MDVSAVANNERQVYSCGLHQKGHCALYGSLRALQRVLYSPWITLSFSSRGVSETMSWGKVIKQGLEIVPRWIRK